MTKLTMKQRVEKKLLPQLENSSISIMDVTNSNTGNLLEPEEYVQLTIKPTFYLGKSPEDAKWKIKVNNVEATETFPDSDRSGMINFVVDLFEKLDRQSLVEKWVKDTQAVRKELGLDEGSDDPMMP